MQSMRSTNGAIMVRRPRTRRILTVAAAAAALSVPLVPAASGDAHPAAGRSQCGTTGCVNGIVPLNPYVVNCNLPSRGGQVIGAAPDAGALIACRHSPTCLSYYVNYPGTVLVPGYRP